MPTLLQINSALNIGSTGKIVEQIGTLAQEKGWSSWVAHGSRYMRPSKLLHYQVNTPLDEWIHGGISCLLDKHGLGSTHYTKRLVSFIARDIQPDIIHIHNIHGYYLNYRILFEFLQSYQAPVVWTMHDCWPLTGHCAYFDFEGCKKWENLCFRCPLKTSYPRSLFIDNSRQNYINKKRLFLSLGKQLNIVTVSKWLENVVRHSFFKDTNIMPIYNGVDLTLFKPIKQESYLRTKYHLGDKFLGFACASPWSKRKGLSDYIKLSQILTDGFQLVLVGLSKEQIQTLPPSILGFERTSNISELVGFYSSADVVLNLSYEETLGMTTIEGMACGTPSIVYNATASPELVDHMTGIVVEKGDIEGIKKAMIEIKNRGKDFYAVSCRNRAVKYFNKATQYKKYIDLYNSLLNETSVNTQQVLRTSFSY